MKRGENRNQIASITDLITRKEKPYEIVTIKLDAARNEVKQSIEGDFFYLLDAATGVDAHIRFNEHDADQITLKKGFRFQVPFYQFFLTNTAQSGVTIRIIIGKDLAFDFAELGVVNVDTINNPVSIKSAGQLFVQGSPLTINDTVGGVWILGTVLDRMMLTLFNEGPNPCRIGKNGVTFAGGVGAAGGMLLNSGASMNINYIGDIYAICDAALTTKLSIWDEWR